MRAVGIGFLLRAGVLLAAFLLAAGLPGRADEGKPETKKADSDEALKEELLALNRVTGEAALQSKLLAFVKDRGRAKKGIALALKMQKEGKGDKPFNYNAELILGRAAHFLKDYTAAAVFYEDCIKKATKLDSGTKILQAYDSLIDLYWDAKKYQKVIEVCTKFVELEGPTEVDNAKPFVLERLVQAKAMLGDTDDALRAAEDLIEKTDGNWYFVKLKGWVQREAGKYDDAVATYKEVLTKLDKAKGLKPDLRDRMKDQVRYTLSGVYVDKKDIDNAAKQLQELIKRHPENPTFKNDLGFIWADHDQKLEEAEKLIREALELDRKRQEKRKEEGTVDEVKENPAYLDSMGWVLFKQKKYKEALPFMKKAATEEGEGAHIEIWDHLGDVYMALGQKKEATDAWQKALTMEDVSKKDAARRKKVIAKLKDAGVEPKVKEPKKKTL